MEGCNVLAGLSTVSDLLTALLPLLSCQYGRRSRRALHGSSTQTEPRGTQHVLLQHVVDGKHVESA